MYCCCCSQEVLDWPLDTSRIPGPKVRARRAAVCFLHLSSPLAVSVAPVTRHCLPREMCKIPNLISIDEKTDGSGLLIFYGEIICMDKSFFFLWTPIFLTVFFFSTKKGNCWKILTVWKLNELIDGENIFWAALQRCKLWWRCFFDNYSPALWVVSYEGRNIVKTIFTRFEAQFSFIRLNEVVLDVRPFAQWQSHWQCHRVTLARLSNDKILQKRIEKKK